MRRPTPRSGAGRLPQRRQSPATQALMFGRVLNGQMTKWQSDDAGDWTDGLHFPWVVFVWPQPVLPKPGTQQAKLNVRGPGKCGALPFILQSRVPFLPTHLRTSKMQCTPENLSGSQVLNDLSGSQGGRWVRGQWNGVHSQQNRV